VRAFELTNGRELKALWDDEALNGGTLQVWGLSAPNPNRGEGSFFKVANFPEVPSVGAWVHAQSWWWQRSCKCSLGMLLAFVHNGNSNDNLGSQQKLHNLEIV